MSTSTLLLRMWFLRPLRDMGILKQRQEAIAYLGSPRNEELTSTLHDCLKHIKNLPVSASSSSDLD